MGRAVKYSLGNEPFSLITVMATSMSEGLQKSLLLLVRVGNLSDIQISYTMLQRTPVTT
jgi:hypothetical protein